jgi:hypothetical protein
MSFDASSRDYPGSAPTSKVTKSRDAWRRASPKITPPKIISPQFDGSSSDDEPPESRTPSQPFPETDDRHYTLFLPPGERRKWIQCDATMIVKGKRLQCQYKRRANHHNRSEHNGVRHTCTFTETIGPLDRLMHDMVSGEAGEMWDAIVTFIGQFDISISTAASSEFHQLIHRALIEGFNRALKHPKGDIEREFAQFCPQRGPTAVRKYVIQAASSDRAQLETVLKENRFAGMTMNGGQIGPLSIFVTNLIAAHLQCAFTAGIAKLNKPHTHASLRDFLQVEIAQLASKDIVVSVITCDGASYQTKALNYQDPDSLQSGWENNAIFSRVLYMPCICHRFNNAYRRLARISPLFAGFLASLRRIALFCRKPQQRRHLGRHWPALGVSFEQPHGALGQKFSGSGAVFSTIDAGHLI